MRNVQNAHQWHCSLPFSASELNNKSRNIILREKERVRVYDREKENISVHVIIVCMYNYYKFLFYKII